MGGSPAHPALPWKQMQGLGMGGGGRGGSHAPHHPRRTHPPPLPQIGEGGRDALRPRRLVSAMALCPPHPWVMWGGVHPPAHTHPAPTGAWTAPGQAPLGAPGGCSHDGGGSWCPQAPTTQVTPHPQHPGWGLRGLFATPAPSWGVRTPKLGVHPPTPPGRRCPPLPAPAPLAPLSCPHGDPSRVAHTPPRLREL